jgi:hypothetical protein
MWEEMAIHFVLGIISAAVKNPAKRTALQALLIHVRDSINALFPGM